MAAAGGWDAAFEAQAHTLVRRVCDDAAEPAARDAAWRELVLRLAPIIEAWAGRSRLLRRCGLTGEDEARTVLVDVLERLARNRHDCLRRYLERRPLEAPPPEHAVVERLARWGRVAAGVTDEESAVAAPAPATDTPLRAYLLNQLEWACKDHVRHRYGWASRASGTEAPPSKRDVNTNASPLDAVPEAAARPPLTDWLTMSRLLDEIDAYAATFPEPMRRALELWLVDHGFDEIAARVPVASAEEARGLVRAAQARLRERFRDAWPL